MGQSQDSATQSQELTDEQKEALAFKQEDIREKTRETCAAIASIESPAARARVHSELLRELTTHSGTSNETVFHRVLNEYPDSIELTAEFEGVEMSVAEELSRCHEIPVTINVENQYVEIEVEVDLREEVEGMCSVSVQKNVSFDGCDIIEAYMDDAGTKDPVFFLAKVTQLLFENFERKVRYDTAKEVEAKRGEEFDKAIQQAKQTNACMAEERDSAMTQRDAALTMSEESDKQCKELATQLEVANACKASATNTELTKEYNAMQERVFALTDVLQGIHDNTFEGTINSACSKAIEEHGLSGDK